MPKSITFDHEETLQMVTDLFWKKGYNGTSMQDLVDVTGLNRSSIYNTFGDKFLLYEESLRHYQLSKNAKLRKTIADAKSPKEAIISLFQGILDDFHSMNNKGCMLTASTMELSGEVTEVRNYLLDYKDRLVAIFVALIEGAQQLGEIKSQKDPSTLALYLFTCLQGLHVSSMLESKLDGVVNEVLNSI